LDAIKCCLRAIARLMDGTHPQATHCVASTIVEALFGSIKRGRDQLGQSAGMRIKGKNSGTHRNNESILRACDAAWLGGQTPGRMSARPFDNAVDCTALDVDPVKRTLPRLPQRAFAQKHWLVEENTDIVHCLMR